MNLFKSFEVFLSAPLSILRDKIIQIVHFKTNDAQKNIYADIGKDVVQIGVVNNERMYSLLSSVVYKRKIKNENQKRQVYNKLAQSGRS